jgi:beta-1,4-mannosyltransferase
MKIYHARSFSKLSYHVNLCGYLHTVPPEDIVDDINIELHPIELITNSSNLPFVMFAAKKIIVQMVQLFSLLMLFRGSDYIMIQNPPSVPLLAITIVFIKVMSRNTKLIIDWHNLNYSILNLRYNNIRHPFVRIMKLYERVLGKGADLNLVVTKQMKHYISHEFGISAPIVTLYDRPARQFHPIIKPTRKQLQEMDVFQEIKHIEQYKIVVSSTSFTPDEDFGILLRALKKYEQSPKSKSVVLVITGKGPMKEQFLTDVENAHFSSKIIIKTAWLSSEDYPKVLASADLGVSLHSSSSGIDLPMKIVDMFGCGVPVISLSFPAIGELVHDGLNGLVCQKDKNPDDEICRLLTNVFTDEKLYQEIKAGALKESESRWDENWDRKLKELFDYELK